MKRVMLFVAAMLVATPALARDQWTPAQANAWYAKQPWLVGSNYAPANAINQLEMWQPETFDPATIDKELGYAESIGMNTMRVFLHNLLWENDPEGLKKRMDVFLTIAAKHKIKPLFVLFDSCWDPNPVAGPQHPPIPGVHNSGWVQAPGAARLKDESQYGKLESYVKGVVGAFANDSRVLGWDLWNEPNNGGGGNYKPTPDKKAMVAKLLPQVFAWARAADPSQPLTSGVWIGEHWDDQSKLDATEKVQIAQSDVMTFHDYSWPETFEKRARQMLSYGRPVICTEYMARGNGSTFDGSLPIAKRLNIGMMNWGFVDGKTQTRMPWDSWKKPYTYEEPTIWFHEVFRADGTPYRQAEADLIKRLATSPKGVVPAAPAAK
ncbi:cellulase family glycosylhydrolase [Sphingomonas sp. HITSZ_GF]|uniref:cellulase family glycosylhydrolase n=1 Tax=Sphingomonas sp. HITSZ_GF TaxID=3037247 RepID=UPI00240E3276|nr:cellulase family glycosylhydrolase [Sphingomonas sp. HITSZ_GF]MDG2534143.1 cellulase family glycosylhydrolase [Sphingomonas sp. HITSZ_GF]